MWFRCCAHSCTSLWPFVQQKLVYDGGRDTDDRLVLRKDIFEFRSYASGNSLCMLNTHALGVLQINAIILDIHSFINNIQMPKTCSLPARDCVVADGGMHCADIVLRAAAGSLTSANDV